MMAELAKLEGRTATDRRTGEWGGRGREGRLSAWYR